MTDTAVSVACAICGHGFEAIPVPPEGTADRRAWPIVFAMRFKELRCDKCRSGWRSLYILSIDEESLSREDLETTFEHLRIDPPRVPARRTAVGGALEWGLAAVVAFAIYWMLS